MGDFRFFWPESIKDFVTVPSAWDSSLNTGLGQSQLHSLWITSYFNFTALFTRMGLDWNQIQLMFWIIPAVLISFFSSFYLFKYLFKEKKYSIIAGFIYTLNTYFLMVLTGGQLGVALSYSLVPLVLLSFIRLIDKPTLRSAVVSGLVLGVQVILDPRIVLITLFAALIYSFFNFTVFRKAINKSFVIFSLPLVVAVLINIFWILPLFIFKSSPIPQGFESVAGFEFFSFANFSNAISLLHPNFPENIFGKVYFLDPKFLALPIIAFGSLFFSKNKNILYFSTLSLLGIFLAKGANPPLGEVNAWVFQNIPGMSAFRDPTKWFILIVLGYSVLIPYSLREFSKRIRFIPILFVLFFPFLIFPILAQVKTREVPRDYAQLKNLLVNDKTFSRTLWIPVWQRYGYFSNTHPAIGREELFKGDYKKQIKQLGKSEDLLRNLSIKYVIVPYDSNGEIFLDDRRYDERQYKEALQSIREVDWLSEVEGFEKIAVFKVGNPKDRFWSLSPKLEIEYGSIKPTEYKVRVQDAKEGDLLVFSEGFDKNWMARGPEFGVRSSKLDSLNSFRLPKSGDYTLRVSYEPQEYVEAGLWVSLATLLASLVYILFGKRLKK
jgi:hypothetical protein